MNNENKGFFALMKKSKLFMFAIILVIVNVVLVGTCGVIYAVNKSGEETSYSSSSSSSKKKSNDSYKSYDAGYNAIYEDDDYSYKRYKNDPSYADGVDDAIEDLKWD